MWDMRQDPKFADYLKSIKWSTDIVSGVYIYSRKIPLTGLSIIKLQRPQKNLDLDVLQGVVKKQRSFIVYVEPIDVKQQKYYQNRGFKLTKSTFLPSKTVHIDLGLSEKKLLANMHHKTRYNAKLAVRKGLVVDSSKDIDSFAAEWQKAAKSRGMWLSQKREIKNIYDSFDKSANILFANMNGTNLGGILLIKSKKTAYYMYAYSTKVGKKLFAPTLLVWEAMRFAKKEGSETFDFEGIYDERYPLKSWKGFTRFKKSFGGEEIEFPGVVRKLYFPY